MKKHGTPIRLAIADDHTLLRNGIRSILLNSHLNIEIVGEAGTGEDAIAVVRSTDPDILLLDLNMPSLSGTDALKILDKGDLKTRVIALTMHNDSYHIRECLQNGAAGFISKDALGEDLFDAIETVMQGSVYLRSEAMAALWSNASVSQGTSPHARPDLLTDREYEIALLIKAGYSSKMIASTLGISNNTARTHRANMMKKLGAHNTAELLNKVFGKAMS